MATTLRFTIGDAFPADDPVARFVTVLAMMSNDWLRLVKQMLASDDDPGEADAAGLLVMSFRFQAALHAEAAGFIGDARRISPRSSSSWLDLVNPPTRIASRSWTG
jgi:hypothetical protein